jgi:DNA processing protein
MKLKYDLKSATYSNSNKNETIQILKLIRSENVGIKTFYSLIDLFGSAKLALENIESMSLKGGRNKPITIYSDEEIEKEVREIEKIGGQLISYKDKKYSKLLSHISDFPPILSCIGNTELLNEEKVISVVGTRNASLMGKTLASKISKDLYDNDFTIVSGLARGIDTAAHEVSIDKTIAVIAGGLGHIYPSENKDLYYKIAKNGLIVSELKIGSIPMAQNFPQRNRIISGLSL